MAPPSPPNLYSRIKDYVTRTEEPDLPAISTAAAITLLVVYTLIYVLPFYISSLTRPSPTLHRDAPSVIRARIRSVTVSCIICCVITFVVLSSVDGGSALKSIHSMGYFPIGLEEAIKCVTLTAILFAGPLFEAGIVESGWRDWIRLRGLKAVFEDWMDWRNFVAGPVTEEILFRSASVPLLLLARTSNSTIIFLTPIIFGLAHVHHFYEFKITHPQTPVAAVLLRSLLQFSYTTLFGGYVTFLYLRTGSLLTVILVHVFCNWRGLPRFWGRLTTPETIPEFGEAKKSEDGLGARDLSVVWTIAYYMLLVGGAYYWWNYLWLLTESTSALAKF